MIKAGHDGSEIEHLTSSGKKFPDYSSRKPFCTEVVGNGTTNQNTEDQEDVRDGRKEPIFNQILRTRTVGG